MSDGATPQGADSDDSQVEPQGTEQDASTPAGASSAPTSDDDWKQTATKWQNRAKANDQQLKQLREQVKKLVDPSQVASAEERLTRAEKDRDEAVVMAMKYRVALAESLPIDLADRLVGSTEDELREDAKKLKGLTARKPAGAVGAQQGSGPNTNTNTTPTDLNALLRAAAGKG